MMQRFKYIISWISWPALLAIALYITATGYAQDKLILYFNFAYIFLGLSLFALERFMPHERSWLEHDRQTIADIAHTVFSKGSVQTLLLLSGVLGLTKLIIPLDEPGYSIWPREWPMPAQIILGMIVAEFGLYWAHRIAHEVPFFWRFHALHHSVKRLWVVNTGRFHIIDSLISIILGMAMLLAAGAPLEVIQWFSAIIAYFGLLTHCNVEMRFGPLSWFFNTPELHRWHHSMDLREGDKNYGENLMIWDQIFGSYYRDQNRRPPANIGIPSHMPERIRDQLLYPFYTKAKKDALTAKYRRT